MSHGLEEVHAIFVGNSLYICYTSHDQPSESHGLEVNLMNNPLGGMEIGKRRWWELIVGVGEGLLMEFAEEVEGGEWGEVEDV